MTYIDKQDYIRYTNEEEEMFEEVNSHFTPQGYKTSEWVKNIMSWLLGDDYK